MKKKYYIILTKCWYFLSQFFSKTTVLFMNLSDACYVKAERYDKEATTCTTSTVSM